MGVENSGQRPSEASLTAWRSYWLECGQSNSKVARKFQVNAQTVARYRKERQWDKWADEVMAKADEISVIPQAKRINNLLNLCDDRIKALKKAAKDETVQGSVAAEIAAIAKTAQLLTGGATDRIDLGGLTDTELNERLNRLKGPDESSPSE